MKEKRVMVTVWPVHVKFLKAYQKDYAFFVSLTELVNVALKTGLSSLPDLKSTNNKPKERQYGS